MKTIIKASLTAILLISAPSLLCMTTTSDMTAATEKHEAKQQEQRDLLSSRIDLTLQAIAQLQERIDFARQQKMNTDPSLAEQAFALINRARSLTTKPNSTPSTTGYRD